MQLLLVAATFFLAVGVAWAYEGDDDRKHVRYDPLLGWTHIENIFLPDRYGPGIHFRTNAQGFRNEHDFSREVPRGKLRVICSGDSFTLAHGVKAEEGWCRLLEAIDPRFETVNMGQDGYGIDQSYLWYREKGTKLDHDIHIFAFIKNDFSRMRLKEFMGYPKPRLRLEEGEIVMDNVPVPRRDEGRSGRGGRLERLSRIWERLTRNRSSRDERKDAMKRKEGYEVLSKVIDELREAHRAKERVFVILLLPNFVDYRGNSADQLREWLREECGKKDVPFVDMVSVFKKLPKGEVRRLFRDVHYSPEGNRLVADVLYKRLLSIPAIEARFTHPDPEALGAQKGPLPESGV